MVISAAVHYPVQPALGDLCLLIDLSIYLLASPPPCGTCVPTADSALYLC
jgi:hypothetical protein